MKVLNFLPVCLILLATGCSSPGFRDFMRAADPTGISKAATQAQVDEENRAIKERKELAAKIEAKKKAKPFRAQRDAWIGKSIDDLVVKWGDPFKAYARADGGRHVTYRHFQERTGDIMWGFEDRYCLTTFVADAKGRVKSWTSTGYCDYIQD